MTEADWHEAGNHVLGMLIRADGGEDAVLLLLNGGGRSKPFVLPSLDRPGSWREVVDTAHPAVQPIEADRVTLTAHSLMLLRFEPPGTPG
jgi:hypothetical protein